MAGSYIGKYDTTAANNTATGTGSVSIAEGMLPSNVNNAMRDIMADIRQWYNSAEWIEYGDGAGSYTPAYASGTSFTIAGADVTSAYHVGRRVKAVGSSTGTIYGSITATAFSTNTTVTVSWDSGSLSSESLTIYIGITSATNTSMPETPSITGDYTLDVSGDIILDADGGDVFFKDGGTTFGSATNTSGNLIIKSGTTTAATFSGANVTLAGTVASGAITSSGIIKTDNTTEATSTTDGSLQTDGGLSIAKDAVFGDDVKLLSDSAVLSFGADSDTTLTHTDGTGLTLNSTNKLLFGDTGTYIHQSADGVLDLVSDTEIEINATTIDINGAVAMDGAITGATNITLSGELDAATLDISGNADIDGTTNLDAVDIDGAVQIDGAVTVGVDDTGLDVKFFGASAGAYGLYDQSENAFEIRGATAAGAGLLKLTTGELTVVDADKLGRIDFQAPLESDGTDAVAIAASIWAEADDTFSSSVNNTDLVFALGKSEAAAEKFRLTADGEIGLGGANYGSDGQVLTSGGAGAAAAWETPSSGVSLSGSTNNTIATVTGSNALIGEANLTFDGTNLLIASTGKLYLNDAGGEHISGSGSVLSIAGGSEIDLTATAIDINGTCDISGQFSLAGTNVTSTATELNLMDGGTTAGTTAVASGDGIVTNDGGTMRQTTVATFDTYLSGSTQTLTNKTLTAPKFADAGYIADANGNELVILQTTSSAVNQFDIHNAATGNNPVIEATGGDSNVGLNFTTKGTGLITFNDLAYIPQQAITSTSNAVAWDVQAKPNAYHLTTENTTFSAPTNATEGAFICLEINYNGSHSIGWNTVFEFAASTEPTETATDAKTDIHVFRYNGAVWQEVGRTMNLSES